MTIQSISRNEIAGIAAGGIVFAMLLGLGGPVPLASLLVKVLPVSLLLLSLYLTFCGSITSKQNFRSCFIAGLVNRYTESLTPWVLLAFILIGSQLVLIWAGEVSSFFYMGGLLPNSDANNYYKGARKILLEGELSEWSSRRPFMTAYLASALTLSKFSLSGAIAIISAVASFSIALFAASLRRSETAGVVFWAFVLVFFFYYRLLGTTLSENLGLVFGSISFVLLWFAANEKNNRWFFAGVFFMALAQVTRSGAVFVLPALLIWGAFWLGTGVRSRLITFAVGVLAVMVAFLANRFLLELGGTASLSGFGNFSYTLYGLSVGEGGWSQIMKDHPEIIALAEPARSQGVYQLAFSNILQEPSRFFSALLRNVHFFTVKNGGLNILTGSKAWLLVQIPSLIGIAWCIRNIRIPRYALLLFVLAGVLVSSSIVAEDGGLRVFAATIPFSAAVAAVGLRLNWRLQDTGELKYARHSNILVYLSVIVGSSAVTGAFLSILLSPMTIQGESVSNKTCSEGFRKLTIPYPARTALHLKKGAVEVDTYKQEMLFDEFNKLLKANGRRREWPEMNLSDEQFSVISVGKYVLVSTKELRSDPVRMDVCVKRIKWLYVSQDLLVNELELNN